MKKTPYYFETLDSEMCYNAKYFQGEMKERGITEMEVYTVRIQKVPGMLFCKAVGEATESEYCGKVNCEDYLPRNGKNGICKWHGNFHEADKKVILKLKV